MLLENILFCLSIRFFLFEFYLFRNIRYDLLDLDNYYISKLLKCTFCQGFWVGFIFIILTTFNIFYSFYFGFISAFICYIIDVLTFKSRIYVEEKKNV